MNAHGTRSLCQRGGGGRRKCSPVAYLACIYLWHDNFAETPYHPQMTWEFRTRQHIYSLHAARREEYHNLPWKSRLYTLQYSLLVSLLDFRHARTHTHTHTMTRQTMAQTEDMAVFTMKTASNGRAGLIVYYGKKKVRRLAWSGVKGAVKSSWRSMPWFSG